jgi:hypothetical protein
VLPPPHVLAPFAGFASARSTGAVGRARGHRSAGRVHPRHSRAVREPDAGLDVASFTLLADARVTRRWQLGADDHTQLAVTLSVGYALERLPR